MIDYEPGYWQCLFVFRCHGSVFPKAVCWAIPSSILSVVVYFTVDTEPDRNVSTIWSSFCFVLGFLIVFRSQQAYSRFWEGTTLLNQVRGEWFNAISSLFAFCSDKEEKRQDVRKFQALIVRLMSLLYCSALQQVAKMEDEDFEILDFTGVNADSLDFWMSRSGERCEILLQWIQKLICMNLGNGVITISPPILSRVFQELSRGIVGVNNATKLSDILFPFPYAQMVSVMLLITTALTPIVAGTLMDNVMFAAGLTFVTVFAFWSINYIAAEIELPFGDDPNDLPIAEYQRTMNRFLQVLMEYHTQTPPTFTPTASLDMPIDVVKMSDESMTKLINRSRASVFQANHEVDWCGHATADKTSPMLEESSAVIQGRSHSSDSCASDAPSKVMSASNVTTVNGTPGGGGGGGGGPGALQPGATLWRSPSSLSSSSPTGPSKVQSSVPSASAAAIASAPPLPPPASSSTSEAKPSGVGGAQQHEVEMPGPGPPHAAAGAQTYNVFVSVGNLTTVAGGGSGQQGGNGVGEADGRVWSSMQAPHQQGKQDAPNFLIQQPRRSETPNPPLGLSSITPEVPETSEKKSV
eukprot:TRINITY_DN9651_c0_g2_i1.p1 TRINITY_DN9651_c0_g2~~TRINITY_DN9651_c0_g2_i1.p1  ORF type:complete len:603 (-),score=120.71 TRINITY_DN9651_c0_g2_i1:49-1791(-)